MLAIGVVLACATFGSYAAPSAKFAATLSSAAILPEGSDTGKVLSTTLKTPNQKDLLIGVSLQTGLFTSTKVSSKNGVADTSTASAKLTVVVKIDGNEVFPGPVVYDERVQTLTAALGGIITTCQDTGTFTYVDGQCVETLGIDPLTGLPTLHVPDGILTIPCECTVLPETIELALKTTGAHHFNFVAKNVTPGPHTVTVEITKDTSLTTTTSKATALVGPGSLTVEEVRATNAPDGIEFLQ